MTPSNHHKFHAPSPSRRTLTQVDTFARVNPFGLRPRITLNTLLSQHFSTMYSLPKHLDAPRSVNHRPPRLHQGIISSLSLTPFRGIPHIPIRALPFDSLFVIDISLASRATRIDLRIGERPLVRQGPSAPRSRRGFGLERPERPRTRQGRPQERRGAETQPTRLPRRARPPQAPACVNVVFASSATRPLPGEL